MKRIQRQRTRGWRMPEGAVYVGRPSRWGNPYWHVERFHGRFRAIRLYRETVMGGWNPSLVADWPDHYVAQIYEDHVAFLRRLGVRPFDARRELVGHDLVCWCPLDQPCHADVLLELAS